MDAEERELVAQKMFDASHLLSQLEKSYGMVAYLRAQSKISERKEKAYAECVETLTKENQRMQGVNNLLRKRLSELEEERKHLKNENFNLGLLLKYPVHK